MNSNFSFENNVHVIPKMINRFTLENNLSKGIQQIFTLENKLQDIKSDKNIKFTLEI